MDIYKILFQNVHHWSIQGDLVHLLSSFTIHVFLITVKYLNQQAKQYLDGICII